VGSRRRSCSRGGKQEEKLEPWWGAGGEVVAEVGSRRRSWSPGVEQEEKLEPRWGATTLQVRKVAVVA
jgi:hypothetical protein